MYSHKIVELFSGTGGMGLAALTSRSLSKTGHVLWSAELDRIYVDCIARNYNYFGRSIGAPEQIPSAIESVDLSSRNSLLVAESIAKKFGKIDLLVAGPPCQGFSLANRRSRTPDNPKNGLSIRVLRFVSILRPSVVVIENVPGIRTLRASAENESAIDVLERRLRSMKYDTRTMLLNAADFGVPQLRLRSFLVAVPKNSLDDLSVLEPVPTHGPGRRYPYLTVQQAFGDLPRIANGETTPLQNYRSPVQNAYQRRMRLNGRRALLDHVTTKHSDYVLSRFVNVPPGGNWQSIVQMMTNYSDAERTHLNIYHRLDPKAPSRTIGNFRKSMLIHPTENRGLSLREAARLQSLPDWYSFVDPERAALRGVAPNLNAYQQQIGNAVSFLLTQHLVDAVFNVASAWQ